ncbi:hypothetical protein CKJ61_10320 [Mycobacterium intracellulare]|nr:hypothetical protein CKJ61_10320 [Mycobacterium intracellulare]
MRASEIQHLTPKHEVTEFIEMAQKQFRYAYGVDFDPLPLAAISLTVRTWRRTEEVEAAHTLRYPRISDGEMFAANVATTRLILRCLHASYPAVDWMTLADDVTNPDRVAGQRTVSDLLGKARHKRWAATARRVIDMQEVHIREYGSDWCWCEAAFATMSPIWWGHPDWEQLVRAFIDGLSGQPPSAVDIEGLRNGLLVAPDELDPQILDWCTAQLIGYTRRERPIERR